MIRAVSVCATVAALGAPLWAQSQDVDQGQFERSNMIGSSGAVSALSVGPAKVPTSFKSIRTAIEQASGHAYAIHEDRLNWHDADKLCRSHGAHLVVVTSAQESRFVTDAFDGFRPWLGAMRNASTGHPEWVTGEPWRFDNWDTGQPDPAGVYLQKLSYGKWRIKEAPGYTGRTHVLCEWEALSAKAAPDVQTQVPDSADRTQAPAAEPAQASTPPATAPRSQPAPGDAVSDPATGHRYRLSDTRATWARAFQMCLAEGGHLATITSAGENAFVSGQFDGSRRIWLGGTDAREEGQWEWVTGEPFDYRAFDRDEPNDNDGGEDFLELGDDGRWNDDGLPKSDRAFYYLCEWDARPGDQPGAAARPQQPAPQQPDPQQKETGQGVDYPRVVLKPKKPNPVGVNVSPPAASVPAGFAGGRQAVLSSTGSAYAVSDTALGWREAALLCQRHGGHLATVNSKFESGFLARSFAGDAVWLGGVRGRSAGEWVWITGERWGATNWQAGQPDDARGGEVYLLMRENGRWHDAGRPGDSITHRGLCEWESDYE